MTARMRRTKPSYGSPLAAVVNCVVSSLSRASKLVEMACLSQASILHSAITTNPRLVGRCVVSERQELAIPCTLGRSERRCKTFSRAVVAAATCSSRRKFGLRGSSFGGPECRRVCCRPHFVLHAVYAHRATELFKVRRACPPGSRTVLNKLLWPQCTKI